MDKVIDYALSDMMARVSGSEAAEPHRRTVHFFFSFLKPAEVEAGPEIRDLFEKKLGEHFSGAEVECQGYVADGYHIKATVVRKQSR
jgi:hypothetical protein